MDRQASPQACPVAARYREARSLERTGRSGSAGAWLPGSSGRVTSPPPPPICYAAFQPEPGENMTGEADLETRRKRLLYRSVYRGNKENDILLGQFARAHIASLSAAEL